MPIYSTTQTHMNIYMGKTPGVDDNHIIDDFSFRLNMSDKAADYTCLVRESGTVFTTSAATTAVNFTLPVATDGVIYWFISGSDGEMMVTAPTAIIVCHDNAAATTIAWTTTAETTGSGFMFFSDGTKWYCANFPGLAAATHTAP